MVDNNNNNNIVNNLISAGSMTALEFSQNSTFGVIGHAVFVMITVIAPRVYISTHDGPNSFKHRNIRTASY